ncbi:MULTISPECIES: cell division protein FtsQ/DivIB [unclassified Acidisoma]|jgi:cell division protein FtsQ|uniref:cell division protein FtsQ/DivIB n=1 Tax=unclassified Acidisoma TaxID=2634065 RepID=UPI00131CC4BD|nr:MULTISPECIES: FtsQ-type POTRA domain-containing protein [unclassified Acidisoma]
MPRVSKPIPPPRMASTSVVDRPSHAAIVLRRARRFLRPLIGGFAILVVIFALSLVFRAADHSGSVNAMRTALGDVGAGMGLKLRHIVIEGRANTPEPILRTALGITTGTPILGFSVAAVRSRVTALGWVQDAVVERRLPDTLLVRLTERAPFAVWQDHGRFRLLDRAGAVMGDKDVARTARELSLPLVVGDGAPDATAELFDEMAPFPDITSHMVAAVRVGQERWNLVMKSGATVMLPGENQDQALGRLGALNTRMKLLDRPLQIVDLRLADRVVVRPYPPPPAPPPIGNDGSDKSARDAATSRDHA